MPLRQVGGLTQRHFSLLGLRMKRFLTLFLVNDFLVEVFILNNLFQGLAPKRIFIENSSDFDFSTAIHLMLVFGAGLTVVAAIDQLRFTVAF